MIIQQKGDQWLKSNGCGGKNGHGQSNQDRSEYIICVIW